MAAGGESIPRLYSRTGDHGTTALHGGSRVDKDSPRVRAYGTYDELGAILGLVEAELPDELVDLRSIVHRLQSELYIAQSELATPEGPNPPRHRIEARHVTRLEADIDRFDDSHERLHSFILSGGSRSGALLQLARTVARRAEREVWALHRTEKLSPELLQWANRLSGLLFALALSTNRALGVAEVAPDYSV
ncbi:MAG TPA: cob(I)yrinic acid a,c-diamide adenosyltransferase [Thermoplasmata archaeon]|nr:cob(I)yrinic acid a,c-diamide adenosyltransferase [Thermoplasmata archaeon]